MRKELYALLVGTLAFCSIYLYIEYSRVTNGANELVASYNSLDHEHDSLLVEYSYVKSQLNKSYYAYNMLLKNYSRTRIIYTSPATNHSIDIWTIPQVIQANNSIQWALLDTFINHIEIRSNQSVQLIILDLNSFVRFRIGRTYTTIYDSTGTYFSTEQHFSQGCGTYVLVILNKSSSPAQIRPNVRATYAPTPFLTGQCSQP